MVQRSKRGWCRDQSVDGAEIKAWVEAWERAVWVCTWFISWSPAPRDELPIQYGIQCMHRSGITPLVLTASEVIYLKPYGYANNSCVESEVVRKAVLSSSHEYRKVAYLEHCHQRRTVIAQWLCQWGRTISPAHCVRRFQMVQRRCPWWEGAG